MHTRVLYCTNTEAQRPLTDPCQGLNSDETEGGKEPSISLMPLLPTTHLDLLVKSIPPLLEQLSFCPDLTGSDLSLPKGYNKLTSEGHNSTGLGQGLGRLVVINVMSLEVELKWKGLVVRHHCSLSNLLKNIYNYQAAFQMYTYSQHPTLKKNSN